jgi:glycine amidinotransferase
VFCPVKPGLIVSTYHHDNYADTFPGWEVKYIQNQSWNAIPGWRNFKHANVDKWWVPDGDNNPEFGKFVDTWLSHWLGYVKETVFDVNMLQINSNTILVNNYNKEMFEFFKQHRIEPIITPFRHRFFWDGGIHCVTADIYREGEVHDYITR